MKQLVFIHGGETFDTYDEYVDALRTWSYDPKKEGGQRWKYWLQDELGDSWEMLMPSMPSKFNAKYLEWSIWFDKIVSYLKDDVILVGHSMGGIFLAKYLNEHDLPVRVRATFLVAAPFDTEGTDYSLADFGLSDTLSKFAMKGGSIFMYHSSDDMIVPFPALEKYRTLLPEAVVREFKDRGHFLNAIFPELLEDIRSLG